MVYLIIALVLVVLFFGLVVLGFNRLRRLEVGAQEALGGIDVQLTRRADLIPNLVSTVKGYAAHEAGVFDRVTEARSQVEHATRGDDVAEKARAEAALDRALVTMRAVAEGYPELRASANYVELQTQLAQTESELSFARRYYNDAVASLNKAVSTIPWMLFAPMAGVRSREFYTAPAAHTTPPTVEF